LVGKGEKELFILPEMATPHGLVAGATGTGKIATKYCQKFCKIGVPVFMSDAKRINTIEISDFSPSGSPSHSGMSSANKDRRFAQQFRICDLYY
jgi:hypothetical protein